MTKGPASLATLNFISSHTAAFPSGLLSLTTNLNVKSRPYVGSNSCLLSNSPLSILDTFGKYLAGEAAGFIDLKIGAFPAGSPNGLEP